MTLTQLRALLAVARGGSIQEAARLMHVTQPAISKAIRDLELELGVRLLIRSSKGAVLSPYGSLIEARAKSIIFEIQKIEEETKVLKGELSGRLSVGLVPVAADSLLADSVAEFKKGNPSVELHLIEMRSPQIIQGLREGTLDIGLLSHFGSLSLPGVQWKKLSELEMILAAGGRSADRFRDRAAFPVLDLADREWLELDTIDDQGGYLAALFDHWRLPIPNRMMRCSSTTLGYALASRIDVITCWARRSFELIEPRFSLGQLVRISTDRPLPKLSISIAYRDESLLTQAARTFSKSISRSFSISS